MLLVLLVLGAVTVVSCGELAPLSLHPEIPHPEEHAAWTAKVLRVVPPLQRLINTSNVSPAVLSDECKAHVDLYTSGIANSKLWALTMLDASTKVPESVLSGAFVHLGNFEQCLGATAETLGERAFSGQYCGPSLVLAAADPAPVLAMQLATCLPDTCSPAEIKELLESTLTPPLSLVGVSVTVTVDPLNCYTALRKEPLDAAAWTMIALFTTLILLMVVGTLLDLNDIKAASPLLSFSLRLNLSALVSTRHVPGSVTCLHGLRVFSLLWVMLGHRYATAAAVPLINTFDLMSLVIRNATFSLVTNGLLAVDTFFFLSGFLVCHVFLSDVTKGRAFNVAKFYLYRYLRLTTSLALVVGYYAALMRYTGTGPAWRRVHATRTEVCRQGWWLGLLYFNNYVQLHPYDPTNLGAPICVDQSWYLTVDMQLAWLSPLVLVPLWKWPRQTSRIVLPLVTLASCFAPFASTYINKFPMTSTLLTTHADAYRYGYEMYYATHMRATPYLVGIAFAYLMSEMKHHKIIVPKWTVLAGWSGCTAVSLAVVLGPSAMYQPGYQYDAVAAAFYAGFHRLAWAFALSWIVFACTRGFGGPVNAILSCKALLPLSRLAYCMFLTHTILLNYTNGSTRTLSYFSHFATLHDFLGDIVMTGGLALLLYLSCEAPTLNMLRNFFQRGNEERKTQTLKKTEK